MSAAEKKPELELKDVVADEIASDITQRREVESLSTSNLDKNLIGLALSGGGIRAGAIGLGVFQGLAACGILRFVDYLSTVSGGGYAGAYLSSYSVARKKAANPKPPPDRSYPPLSIMPEADGRVSERLRTFVDTGRKLNHPLNFFNRYLVGLLLLWVVIGSGLVALASFSAWVFRLIYNPLVLDRLAAIGFRNDLQVCLFPPLLVFLLWLATWALSYYKRNARATGEIARVLFFILLLTCGISVAAILGAGDIDVTPTGSAVPSAKNAAASGLASTVYTFLITAILAGLLPYLNPMRLFKSGAAPKNTAEKYVYAVASRMLIFGLPFLAMSYFVREDISGWYAHRDGSVFRSEINDWSKFDPAYTNQIGSAQPWFADGTPVRKLFAQINELQPLITSYEFDVAEPNPDHPETSATRNPSPTVQRPKPFWRKWAAFCSHIANGGYGTSADSFGDYLKAAEGIRNVKREIAMKMTAQLQLPDFAMKFLPSDALPNEKLTHLQFPTPAARDAWIANLKAIRREAELVGRQFAPAAIVGQAITRQVPSAADLRKIVDANRKLLQAYFGDALAQPTTVFSGVVWEHDQKTRMTWFLWSLAIFVVSALSVDLNATSCHGFYAQQTAEGWIEPVDGTGRDIRLVDLKTTESGSPYHLMSGSVRLNILGRRGTSLDERDAFLFSRLYCGADGLAYVPTADYMGGTHTLPDAIAASGGAVSPTEGGSPLAAALLTLTNLRLGQWLENPAYRPRYPKLWQLTRNWPFSPAEWMRSLLFDSKRRSSILVNDGGYYENLGIEALLRRKCKLIIAVDAGQDAYHHFEDFLRIVRRANLEYGICFESIDSESLPRELLDCISLPQVEAKVPTSNAGDAKSDKSSPWTKKHYALVKIHYPSSTQGAPGSSGLLIYLKSSLTGDEPLELINYQKLNPTFPHDATSDQLYSADQFISYLQLGRHLAEEAVNLLSVKNKKGELKPLQLDSVTVDAIEAAIRKRDSFRGGSPAEIFAKSFDSDSWGAKAIRAAVIAQHPENIVWVVEVIVDRKLPTILPVARESLTRSANQPVEVRISDLRSAIVSELRNLN